MLVYQMYRSDFARPARPAGCSNQEAQVHQKFLQIFAIAVSLAATTFAQPVINAGPVNSASYRTLGMPGSGIAQGSIFSVFGTGLGPATSAQANTFPLPTSLGGSSIDVTVGGATTQAIILFTYDTQINAILPSNTPVGAGTLTVTYNSQAGTATPITVVASAFGAFVYNSSGSGQAIATDTSYVLNTIVHTFHPGDYVFLWGTGLGAIGASDAEPPPAGNLPGPLTIHVGNTTAPSAYNGRAPCCAGLDQVAFQVPTGVQGCYVPVGIETAGGVSNVTTIAVSASGQTCSDSVIGQDLTAKLASGSTVDFGYIRLESYFTKGYAQMGSDYALASFSELDPGSAGTAEYGVSNGYCYSVDCSLGCAVNGGGYSGSLSDSSPAQLDAGALDIVYGTSIPLTQYGGYYAGVLSGNNGSRFLWSMLPYNATATGGANVGAFTATDITAKLTVDFSNISTDQVLPRAGDLAIRN